MTEPTQEDREFASRLFSPNDQPAPDLDPETTAGNYVPHEGTTPSAPAVDDAATTVRNLFN